MFLTCSCTGLVERGGLPGHAAPGGVAGGATVQVLRVGGAGADHPFLLHVPEGRYLKAVFCRVE